MNKFLSLSLLPIVTSFALISTGCSDDKKEINQHNTYIMTGVMFHGPIKSVRATIKTPNEYDYLADKTEGNLFIDFSPKGELTSYKYSTVSYISNDSLENISKQTYETSIDKNTNYEKTISSKTLDSNNLEQFTQTVKFYFNTDENGKINNIRIISKNSKPITNTQTIAWENDKVSRITGHNFLGIKTSIKYNYNAQGVLISLIDSSANTKQNKSNFVTIKSIDYSYDKEGFLNKQVAQFYGKNSDSEYTYHDITLCLDNDSYGNCLTEKISMFSPEDKLIYTTINKYEYQYY
ncbi:TPA: hypothetical protein ACKRTE_001211 [Providencia rettgeri]